MKRLTDVEQAQIYALIQSSTTRDAEVRARALAWQVQEQAKWQACRKKQVLAHPQPRQKTDTDSFWTVVSVLGVIAVAAWWIGAITRNISPKTFYSIEYGVPEDKVMVESQPHDCEFNVPPYGEKNCHYERIVTDTYDASGITGSGHVASVFVTWSRVNE